MAFSLYIYICLHCQAGLSHKHAIMSFGVAGEGAQSSTQKDPNSE